MILTRIIPNSFYDNKLFVCHVSSLANINVGAKEGPEGEP